jgi:putative ABC transport system permease protein
VVVLGSAVADTLFGGVIGAVGQSIRINGQQFRVIGVLASKGGTGFLSQDDQVIMPMTTVQFRLVGRNTFRGANVINTINIQVNSPNAVTQAKTDITAVMRDRHQTSAGTDDFTVTSQQDVLGAITQVTNTLSIFLGGIAGISLLVGGIGIMNIMLTTVSERTREIGLRKAIGARRRDILYQFLIEAMTLSLLGGVIGIFFGWLIGQVIGKIQLGGSTLTAVVSPNSVLLATLFSMAVGLFFGSYPAMRAARLLPVEALRYE